MSFLDFFLNYLDEQRKIPVHVRRADRNEVGGCNACSSNHVKVWVVMLGGSLQVRLCDSCGKLLRQQLK